MADLRSHGIVREPEPLNTLLLARGSTSNISLVSTIASPTFKQLWV